MSPQQFTVTLTVTDVAGVSNSITATVVATPAPGAGFSFSNAPLLIKGVPLVADDPNTIFNAHETLLAGQDSRIGLTESALAQIGDPLTPRRHNGALYASINPEAAGSFLSLNAATMYVVRCMTINGEPFSSVHWVQVAASPSAVTNAFWAVYDVSGALMSPTTVTDVSSSWSTAAEQSFTLDGGPFDPPFGADNTDTNTFPPTNEFFLAFYFGTVGATKPQIAVGSQYANAINIGTSTSAITPSQTTIQQVPIFATAANTPSTNLQPPATLGALTRLGASVLVALYP
jgi:hypothetical protein